MQPKEVRCGYHLFEFFSEDTIAGINRSVFPCQQDRFATDVPSCPSAQFTPPLLYD